MDNDQKKSDAAKAWRAKEAEKKQQNLEKLRLANAARAANRPPPSPKPPTLRERAELAENGLLKKDDVISDIQHQLMKCQASNQEKSTLMLEKEEQLRQLHERLNQINGELHEKDNMIEGLKKLLAESELTISQCRIDAIEKQRSIDTLNKLSAEKQEVINQLRKTSTISSRPVSMKPYCELTNQGKDARVTKMVEAGFQESDKVTMEDLADVNHRFFQYFNIEQPKKERTPIRFTDRTPSKDLIDPLLDLKLMTKWKMSWKQRELMKSDLINVLKKDFLAPNHQVRKLIKSLCEKAVYVNKTEQLDSTKEGVKVFSNATLRLCTNIKEFVEMRLNRLMRNGKLLLDGPFNGKIWLALTGDKGNEVTKLGLIIGNVALSNAVNNMMFIGLFPGDESANNLQIAFKTIMPQIENLREVQIGGRNYEVMCFVVADMKFLCTIYGHMGASSSFNCLLCKISKDDLSKGRVIHSELRTLEDIVQCLNVYQHGIESGQKNTTVLSKKAFSISKPPLLNIPLSHVVPSPLHLIMGIAMELLKVLEAYCNELDADEELAYVPAAMIVAPVLNMVKRKKKTKKAQGDIYTELENAYLKVGADRRAFHQRFVGNHIRKLLSMDGAKTITEILPESKKRNSIRDLLCRLGSIQSYTKSEFLTELEIAKLDLEILEFRNKYKEFAKTVTALHFTPKFHWLTKHTMEFVKRFNTWGKLNEQPVESVHHQVNLDMTRVGNVRDQVLIYERLTNNSCIRNTLFDEDVQIESIPDEEMLIVDEEYLNLLTSNR